MNLFDPELPARWIRSGIVYGGGYATPSYRLFCTSRVASLAEDVLEEAPGHGVGLHEPEGVDRKYRAALVEMLEREIYDKVDVETYGAE